MAEKILLILTLCFSANAAIAWEFVLNFDQQCDYEASAIQCKAISGTAPLIQREDGTFVTSALDAPVYPLRIIRNDENMLILMYDTTFSGARFLYVMKKTMTFHWTEIAYSEIAGEGVHYKRGTLSSKDKNLFRSNRPDQRR